MKIRNKIMSFALSLALLFGILFIAPMKAHAAPTELVLDISGHTRIDINSSTYEWNSTPLQSFDPSNDVIVLTGTGDCAIYISSDNTVILRDLHTSTNARALLIQTNATIVLDGINEISSGRNPLGDDMSAIYVNAPGQLTIEGTGSLIATGYGVAAGIGGTSEIGFAGNGGNVIINSGNVTAIGGANGGHAIGANATNTTTGSLTVNGGTLIMGNATNPKGFGPQTGSNFVVNGGSVSIFGQTAPSIIAVNPDSGLPGGGTDITLTGSGFTGVSDVKVGGVTATNLTVVDDNTITCTTPAGTLGTPDIVVLNPSTGTDTLVGGFNYALTAITGVTTSPATIPYAGAGSTITVSGNSLPNGILVTAFDGASPTSITGTTTGVGNQSVSLSFPANTSTTTDKTYTVKASLDGGATWDANVAAVTVNMAPIPGVVATPTANPTGSEVAGGTAVTLSCTESGAAIHYTTDGTAPTASSAVYSSPITVNSAMTIQAIAVKSGMTDSAVMSESYTIAAVIPPQPTVKPEVTPTTPINLDLNATKTANLTVTLGQSGGGTMASQADISSDNTAVAEASPAVLTADGNVTVTAKAVGNATITVTFDTGEVYAIPVSVTNSYTAPSTSGGSGDNYNGKNTPDTAPSFPTTTNSGNYTGGNGLPKPGETILNDPTKTGITPTIGGKPAVGVISAAPNVKSGTSGNPQNSASEAGQQTAYTKAQFETDWKLATASLGDKTAVLIRGINYSGMDAMVLDYAYAQAKEKGIALQFHFDEVMGRDTKNRLYVTPAAKNSSYDLLGDKTAATALITNFQKSYTNSVMAVSFEGSGGSTIRLAAGIPDVVKMTNPVVYSYNAQTGVYTKVTGAKIWLDKNGYVHFTAPQGTYVISDGEMVKK